MSTSASSRQKPNWMLRGVVLLLGVVIVALLSFADVITDYQWYSSLNQTNIFWTRFWSQALLFAGSGILAGALVFLTSWIALKQAPGWKSDPFFSNRNTEQTSAHVVDGPFGSQQVFQMTDIRDSLQNFGERFQPFVKWLIVGVSVVIGLLMGVGSMSQWESFRLALARVPFGIVDPQFKIDAGFYVFQLPVIDHVVGWLGAVIIFGLLATVAVYFLRGGIKPWSREEKFAPHVKAHLSAIGAFFVLLQAGNYCLALLKLNYSPRGQVLGPSYTDVHAQIPAYLILAALSVVTAGALLLNIKRKGWKLPVYSLAAWAIAAVVVGGVFPAVMQQFVVAPNEASLEKPYLERNIKMTRAAFNLTDVAGQTFNASDTLTADSIKENATTVDNIRLWDPIIAQRSYNQLQAIRPYYDFADVDVDRYEIDGKLRQVLVAAREMDSTQLAETAQTWVNQHLIYTHGFGMVMNVSSEIDARGLPNFVMRDIPTKITAGKAGSSPELEIKQPRIYYGEKTTDYVIVNTGIEEFDYPLGEKNATYTYEEDAGVPVGGFINRALWATKLDSAQMMLSNYIKSDSRILINRDIRTRVGMLAPWLTLDQDPYPVLADGKIYYVVDGYTTTSMFPTSERVESGINYIRGSVKVVMDAYTGDVTFYAFDESDPILQAWKKVFPEMFTDKDEMPQSLKKHMRYPQGLFSVQADIYRTYHMTDASVFYNKEDQWEIPGARDGSPMEPFFVLLQLPGSDRQEFYMMQPYTPRNRDNMIGWMAVSSNIDDYGKRVVYLFPKERVIFGPDQIAAQINQDPVISPQLSLWHQRGSQVIFGNMVAVPIADSIVYVQPLFLQAEKTSIPELVSVVVAYGDQVVMDKDLKGALLKVFGTSEGSGGSSGEGTTDGGVTDPGTGGSGSDGSGGLGADATIEAAAKLYDEALAAQKQGDWATYGAKISQLGELLGQLTGK